MPGPTEQELLAAARRADAIRDNPETDPDAVARAESLGEEYRRRARVAREGEMRRETVVGAPPEKRMVPTGFELERPGRAVLEYEKNTDEPSRRPTRRY